MPITLPALALLPKHAQALREHRKRHHAEFEQIVRHKTGVTRYYSNEPAVCVGQWVLSQFNPESPQWLLLSPMTDNDNITSQLQWYGLHVNAGQVQREHIDTLESLLNHFAFECTDSEHIYTPLVQSEDKGGEEAPPKFVLPTLASADIDHSKLKPLPTLINLSPNHLLRLPKRYLTRSQHRWQRPALISMACLCLTGLGVWLALLNSAPQIASKPKVDPLATWMTQLGSTPSSTEVFKQSSQLLAQARLLPSQWNAETLALEGTTLTLKVTANNLAPNVNALNIWRQQLSRKFDVSWDSDTRQLTTLIALNDMPIAVLGRYPDKLYEQLRLIGINTLALTQNPTIGQVENWTLDGTVTGGSLATLSNLAYLTANKPVFISSLTVTPHEKGKVDMTFNLTLLGVTQ